MINFTFLHLCWSGNLPPTSYCHLWWNFNFQIFKQYFYEINNLRKEKTIKYNWIFLIAFLVRFGVNKSTHGRLKFNIFRGMFLTSFDVQEGVQQTVKRQLSTKLNNNVFNGCPGKTNSTSKIRSFYIPDSNYAQYYL